MMLYNEEIKRYVETRRLSGDFLGLNGAPKNNIKYYSEREKFSKWAAKNIGVGKTIDRIHLSKDTLFNRLGIAAYAYKANPEQLGALVAIMILESGATNAGFGRDAHGYSTAIGPMQVKWSAVMDAGLPFESWLDILTDRDPLVGVDAGVGYYLRISKGRKLMDGVARYNNPSTSAATNREYCEAFDRARNSSMYQVGLAQAVSAFERQRNVLCSADKDEG